METALCFQASAKPNLSAYCKEIRAFTLKRRGKILLTVIQSIDRIKKLAALRGFYFKMSLSSGCLRCLI